MSKFLQQVNSPADLKKLTRSQLPAYANEVREYISGVVCENGGHLASNLGAVELTVALHYVFNAPEDKLIFDVGHQSYAHKIITGRRDDFVRLRTDGGITGFPNASESEYDVFTTGHASTSLSLAAGLVRGRDMSGENYNVVAVVGDGAFTGGMAFEALNDIGERGERIIIVLNDNKMSISQNVGAFSSHLARLRVSKNYGRFKNGVKKAVSALPFFGDQLVDLLSCAKSGVRRLSERSSGKMFENFGVRYYGPFDGHNISDLINAFERTKNCDGPVLLHVVTQKGRGIKEVEDNPRKFHGVPKKNESCERSFSKVCGKTLCELARDDNRIVTVTAAMTDGTGLTDFANEFPARHFDVGIAEEHAATMCAGLSAAGMKPYFAVYSSFLQRCYDQILHDVCIDKRNVVFLVEHAGVVEGDGVTHQGIMDISILNSFPNMTLLQPKDGVELADMIKFSSTFKGPVAIRYPKSYERELGTTHSFRPEWEVLEDKNSRVIVLACGNRAIFASLGCGATVVSARVIKPLDVDFLTSMRAHTVITVEDGSLCGGFGESVRAFFARKNMPVRVITFGYCDEFLTAASREKLLAHGGINRDFLHKTVKNLL